MRLLRSLLILSFLLPASVPGQEIPAPEEIFGTVQAMSIEEGFLILRDAEGKERKFAVDENLTTIVNVIARRVGKRVVHSVQARKLETLPAGKDVVVRLGTRDGRTVVEEIRFPFREGNHAVMQVFYATDRLPTAEARSGWRRLLEDFRWALPVAFLTGVFFLARKRRKLWRFLAWTGLAATILLTTLAIHAAIVRLSLPIAADDLYSNERGRGLELGTCTVTVPLDHRMGEIEAPSILRFEFRYDPDKHIVLQKIEPCGDDAFYAGLQASLERLPKGEKEALVFVHGYKVSFHHAALRTAQLAYDLQFAGAPIFYSWPSQGGLLQYTVDESNAEWTVYHLRRFLNELAQRGGLDRIHLIAHSMGNRALTNALRTMKETDPALALVQELVLAAPDIDAEVFRRDIAPVLREKCRRVTLYASSRDQAMKMSKQIHGYPRAGESGPNLVVQPGIDTIDVSLIDTSFVGHSYYGDNRSLIADLIHLLEGRRPPEREHLLPREMRGLPYWYFAAKEKDGETSEGSKKVHE